MKITAIFSVFMLLGLTVPASAIEMHRPLFLECAHIDREVQMPALQDFEIFVDGLEAAELIMGERDSLTGSVATEVHGMKSMVSAAISKADEQFQINIDFGDGMNTIHLNGQVDFEQDKLTVPFNFGFNTETQRFATVYAYDCKTGLR